MKIEKGTTAFAVFGIVGLVGLFQENLVIVTWAGFGMLCSVLIGFKK